jgi:hypothetical protein
MDTTVEDYQQETLTVDSEHDFTAGEGLGPEISVEDHLNQEHNGQREDNEEENSRSGEGTEESQEVSEDQGGDVEPAEEEDEEFSENMEGDEEPSEGQESEEDGDEEEVVEEITEEELDKKKAFTDTVVKVNATFDRRDQFEAECNLEAGGDIIDCIDVFERMGLSGETVISHMAKKTKRSKRTLQYCAKMARLVPRDDASLRNALRTSKLSWRRQTQLTAYIHSSAELAQLLQDKPDIATISDKEFRRILEEHSQKNQTPGLPGPTTSQEEIEKAKKKALELLKGTRSTKTVDEVSQKHLKAFVEELKENLSEMGEIISEASEILVAEQGAHLLIKLTPDQCARLHEVVLKKRDEEDEEEDNDDDKEDE